jgi:ABC-type hemin transport system substrate-binding protein
MRGACLALLICLASVIGCAPAAPPEASPQRRIVCLVPAITRMIVDLGLGEQVVGVAEYDALAEQGRPIVGHFASVDTELLLSLQPDLVITLDSKDSPSKRLKNLAADGLFELIAEPYPTDIDAVANTLHRPGADNDLGDRLGVTERAAALRREMIDRLDAVRRTTAGREPVRVLMCIGLSPVMASGSGTVHDQLLGVIHATNAAADATGTAPTFDREMLIALNPDLVLLLEPDGPPLAGPDDHRLDDFRGLPIPAVQNNRIHVINDPHCMLPSTNLPALAERFAQVVHSQAPPVTEPGDG